MKHKVRSFLLWLSVSMCFGVACTPVASVNPPPKLVPWAIDLPQLDRDKVVQALRARQFAQLEAQYGGLQQQYERGEVIDRELTLQYKAFYETSPDLESILTEWIDQRPTSYPARLARGIYYRKVGEAKRGGEVCE